MCLPLRASVGGVRADALLRIASQVGGDGVGGGGVRADALLRIASLRSLKVVVRPPSRHPRPTRCPCSQRGLASRGRDALVDGNRFGSLDGVAARRVVAPSRGVGEKARLLYGGRRWGVGRFEGWSVVGASDLGASEAKR